MRHRFVFLCALAMAANGIAQSTSEDMLEHEFVRLAELSGGVMGVAAYHLESGRAAYLNADERFPMASTYKVPIAVRLLHLVDEQQLRLDQMVRLEPSDLSPGSGTISRLLNDPGVALSLRNLLELMMLISDNTATDICLRHAGGGKAVTAHMKTLGIEEVRVDRSTTALISEWIGLDSSRIGERENLNELLEQYRTIDEATRDIAAQAFEKSPMDTATPRGMARLLEKIWDGQALGPTSRALLIDIMERCESGERRLKGRLPEATVVAHKTGTIGRTTNDVGIITLPANAGHVIVVAFVKESELSISEREDAIAEVARAAHDYFLFRRQPN